jgi:hypothetical protein
MDGEKVKRVAVIGAGTRAIPSPRSLPHVESKLDFLESQGVFNPI